MKKYSLSLLIIVYFASLVSVINGQIIKPWTLLVYVAESGDDSRLVLENLKKMIKIGSNDQVNMVVYITFQESSGENKTKKLYVEKNNLRQIGPMLDRDSGDVSTFAEALQWATLDYPSEHLAVVVVGRGVGIVSKETFASKALCYDFKSENYLTDSDCYAALSWIYSYVRKEQKIDIIACESSFLGSLEMAHVFAPFADYFIAPEGKIGTKGFAYDDIMVSLIKKKLTPLELAQVIISSYGDEHGNNVGYALSLIDLRIIPLLIDNVNIVAQVLDSHCNSKYKDQMKEMIKKSAGKSVCPSFNSGIYIDLCQFYRNLLKNIADLKLSPVIASQFEDVLKDGIELFAQTVKEQIAHRKYKKLGGLSVYFARKSVHPSYFGSHWIANNPQWLYFLESFLK